MAENKESNNSTAKSLFWAALSNSSQLIVTMLIGIVMARQLSVSDYALVAMLSVFSALAGNLQESGFTSALCIKKEAKHEDFNAVFWFSILVSFSIYTLLFFCTPAIARFNNTKELTLIGRVIFIGFFITSIGVAQTAYLYRNLMIKQKTTAQILASTLSGIIGLIAAFTGWGYWSLVVMDLSYKLTHTSLVWYFSPWRPTFNFNLRPAFNMFGFSSRLLATNMLNTINTQLLQSILGHYYVAREVGQYSQANKWTTMGTNLLTGMMPNVTQPILASANEQEGRQLHLFRKMLRLTSMLAIPSLLGLGLIANEFIYLTIGEKWLPCVPYLQTLCIAGAIIPINQMFSNLLISKGKSNYYLISTSGFLLLQLGAVLVLYSHGIQTLLYVITSLNALWLVVWYGFAHRLVNITFFQTLSDILPFALASVIALTAGYFAAISITLPLLSLLVKVIVTALAYAILLQLSGAQIWRECTQFMLNKFKK